MSERLVNPHSMLHATGRYCEVSKLKLDHIRVDVSDIEAAERFYREGLGLQCVVRYELVNGMIVQMAPDGIPPGVELWLEVGVLPNPSVTEHLAFAVDDVVEWVDRVRGCGYPIIREPYVIGEETVAFVQDPDGHLIELNDFKGRRCKRVDRYGADKNDR